jgi:hypothetical protein
MRLLRCYRDGIDAPAQVMSIVTMHTAWCFESLSCAGHAPPDVPEFFFQLENVALLPLKVRPRRLEEAREILLQHNALFLKLFGLKRKREGT